jgi:hypothetical protein
MLILACHSKSIPHKESLDSKVSQIEIDSDTLNDRLKIIGDFDGDKRLDTLKESFISSIDGKEFNKYADLDFDSLVSMTIKRKPICRLISNNLSSLTINKDQFQLFGLAFLKNEGDLDNNGNDELGLIVDWADQSNVNYYKVYTYKNNNWVELLNFEIRDFEIPDLKENKDKEGLLYKNKNGNLIAKTWEMGEQLNKPVELKK